MAKKTFIQNFAALLPEFKKRYAETLDMPAYGQAVNDGNGNPIPGYENMHWAGKLTRFASENILEAYDMFRMVQATKEGQKAVAGQTKAEFLELAEEKGVIDPDPLKAAFGNKAPNRGALLRAILRHRVTESTGQKTVSVKMLLYLLAACSDIANKDYSPRANDAFGRIVPALVAKADEFVTFVPVEAMASAKEKAEIEEYNF
jgi:hypothetical protein